MNILTSRRTITEAFRLLGAPAAVHGPQSAAAARTKCRLSGDLADADLNHSTSGFMRRIYASESAGINREGRDEASSEKR